MTVAKKRPSRKTTPRPQRLTAEDELGRGKLNVEGMDENYVYHVFNDEGDRINYAKRRGYEIVTPEEGVTMGACNPTEAGGVMQTTVNRRDGTKGVLMKIRKEWWEEDRKFKDEQIAKREEQIFRQAREDDGRYGKLEVEN